MTRDTWVQGAASVVLIVSLLSSAALATRLSGLAGKNRLTYTERAEDGQTWEVAAGIAMGAFRGIFVNWLWIRANDLKEEGKFYEANQLAEVITQLQPRFPRVWVFHAWNMAYNISVATQRPDERWEWLNKGISLLRDKAIPANPNDLLLHKELAWIYLHKVGGYTDDANGTYKRRFAQEWTVVLGPPPARDSSDRSRKNAIEKHAAWLRKISEAPDRMDDIVAKEPTAAVLRERLINEAKMGGVSEQLLARYELAQAMHRSNRRERFEKNMGPDEKAFYTIMNDPAMGKAWEALLPAVRKRVLVDRYHMEPDRMVRYTELYGPIDWRHPAAHSLYWSARGVEVAMVRYRGEVDRPEVDFLNTDRVTVQAIQELFRGGDVYFDFLASITDPNPSAQPFVSVPNVHFVQAYADVLDSMFGEFRGGISADRFQRQFTMLWHGYENFIREAIAYYYRRGQKQEAGEWLARLRNDTRKNTHNQFDLAELELPLAEFVENELRGEASRPSIAVEQTQGSLVAAYASGLLVGDQELFNNQFTYAKKLHKYYMEEQLRPTPAGGSVERMAQMDPDFEILAGQLFAGFLSALSFEDAQVAYLNAPNNLKVWGYDAMFGSHFKAQADAENKDGGKPFDDLFPRPPNFDEYVKDIRARLEARRDLSQDVEQK